MVGKVGKVTKVGKVGKVGLISSPKNDTPRVGGDYDVERYATFLRNDYTFH